MFTVSALFGGAIRVSNPWILLSLPSKVIEELPTVNIPVILALLLTIRSPVTVTPAPVVSNFLLEASYNATDPLPLRFKSPEEVAISRLAAS